MSTKNQLKLSDPLDAKLLNCYWTKQKQNTGYFAELYTDSDMEKELAQHQLASDFKHSSSDEFVAKYGLEEV